MTKVTFKTEKELVNGVAYPSKGTGARFVWDAADAAAEAGDNGTDLVARLTEQTDMSKGTISSQLTYWRKATGKVLAKKVDETAAQRAAEKAQAKADREAAKAQREADRAAKKKEREDKKAEREAERARKAEERRLKDEEKLAKLQEKVAAAQAAQAGESNDSEE